MATARMRRTQHARPRSGWLALYQAVIAVILVAMLAGYVTRPYYPSLLDLWVEVTGPATPASPQGALAPVSGDARFGLAEAFHAPAQAQAAGARWERIVFWWSGLQPTGPQDWNNFYLGPYDYVLKRERKRGFEVVGVILNTPAWASEPGAKPGTAVPRNLYKAWDDPENYWGSFVRRVVSHYKGDVDTWIIGNEPDIRPGDANSAYFTWNGSVEDYAQLLKVAYLNAKAANPNAKIAVAGLTYWTDKQAGRPQYFERLLDVLAADPQATARNYYFDIATLHLYIDPRQFYTVPAEFRGMMAEHNLHKPLWITEANVALHDDRDTGALPRRDMRVSQEEQASFIIQAFALSSAAGVDKLGIYKMRDSSGEPVNGQALMRADGSIRPAYVAYQVAAQYFAGPATVTRDPLPGSTAERIVFDKGTQRISVLWTFSPQAQEIAVPVWGKRAYLVDQRGNQFAVGAFDGKYLLMLSGATANTNQHDPQRYLIGGRPLLLVEER